MDYTFHFGEVLRYWPLLIEGLVNTLLLSGVAMAGGTAIGIAGAADMMVAILVLMMMGVARILAVRRIQAHLLRWQPHFPQSPA